VTAERWEQIKSVFVSALDLSGDDRQRFLERLAIADSEICGEVGRLLQNAGEAGSFMENPAWSLAAAPAREPEHVLRAGQVLNERFEIKCFLGAGGMGEVYAAGDRELGEQIAIKTLLPHIAANPSFVNRLRKELQLARRISHPNICRVFEISRCASSAGGDLVFLTMELLAGRTLAETVRAKPFSEVEAMPVAMQLLEGLAAAHRAGIVHRDFKSANAILVGQRAGEWRVVITDFGLSRESEKGADENTNPFGTGAIVGTPAYMAPEQLQEGVATPLSDIYAVGVVLFEMLTGRLPFEGHTPLAVALKRIHTRPPSPREFVPKITRRWEATILGCMASDPAARPQSAVEVMQLLSGERTPPVSRRKWLIAAGAAAVTGGGLMVLYPSQHPLDAEAVKSFKRGEEFAKRRSTEDLKNALEEYGRAVRIEPGYAAAWAGLADAYSAMSNFGFMDARKSLNQARAAAERAVRLDPRLARAQGVLGYVTSINLPTWLQAEPYFRRAEKLDPTDPSVRLWYGAYLCKEGRFDESIAQLKAALERNPESFLLNHQLAASYLQARRDAEFDRQCRELVRLQPFEATAHIMLARSLQIQGRYQEALERCDEAQKYRNTVTVRCVRAMIEADRGNMAAAQNAATELEQYWRQNPFETSLLAGLLVRIGQSERALDLLYAAYDLNDSSILTFVRTRYADPIRDHPRFRQLVKKLRL
jgi:serine/threonine protein kinase/cytochrome c-type biogenesis protein CcmH/NrfG